MPSTETAEPSRTTASRRLSAIAHADMVGYSRLIGTDDAGTLRRLKALRINLIDPAIMEHGGRIVQTGGDSLLVIFESIDGAVRWQAETDPAFEPPKGLAEGRLRHRVARQHG